MTTKDIGVTTKARRSRVRKENKMNFVTADRSAFDAYNILYYPLFGDNEHGSAVFSSEVFDNATEPSVQDCALALAVQENLEATSYTLSQNAIETLARTFCALRGIGGDNFANKMIDPSKDVRSFCPDDAMGQPMYPDFPTQVLAIDEDEFRSHQLTHYFSTYGIEALAGFLGIDMTVREGWMPDVEVTDKVRDGGNEIEKHVLDIIVSQDAMAHRVERDFSRSARMSAPAIELALKLFADDVLDKNVLASIAFHENMMQLIIAASDKDSASLQDVLEAVCQHPGDVFKAVLEIAQAHEKNHLSTKNKKAICRALATFDKQAIASNMADLSRRGEKAANMLSLARFGNEKVRQAVELVRSGEVRSYASRLESAWEQYESGNDSGAEKLLALYDMRPGVMFRALGRLVDAGVSITTIEDMLTKHADDFSIATLVQFVTVMTGIDTASTRDWSGRVIDSAEDDARRSEKATRNAKLASIVTPILAERMGKIDNFEGANKKVFIDTCGFSLVGSVIVPNEIGNASGAYPPAGMAFDIPSDKTLRFFTFWNDASDRVDVDLHFHYMCEDGRSGSAGWNAGFRDDGMVFSGDIVTSIDSAEYLDVDMVKALNAGVTDIYQLQHVYTRQEWKDIETCFSGALIIGDTAPDTKLYQSQNVLFHDDMNGSGNSMNYAMIDVPNHFVRILRGAKLPYRHTEFTLEIFVNMFLEAQGCEIVDSIDDADVVLAVGRAEADEIEGKKVISLLDNNFFVH